MIGINNRDSSFFRIATEVSGFDIRAVLNPDIISLTIVEQRNMIVSGSIKIYDPFLAYPSVLTFGMPLTITWGYKDFDTSPKSLALAQKTNIDEVQGVLNRTIKAIVTSPSGGGDSSGLSTYNINFMGSEILSAPSRVTYKAGLTKLNVIQQVFDRLGVNIPIIKFEKMTQLLTKDTEIYQWETDFRFLHRLANEWRTIFAISSTPSGSSIGVFCDYAEIGLLGYEQLVSNAFAGNSILLEWKDGINNVISYGWKHNIGSSGQGDNVNIFIQNGQPVIIRTVYTTDKVMTYRFDADKVRKELKLKKDTGGSSALIGLYQQFMKAKTFEEVKWAFTPEEQTTAPQGLGYTLDGVKMIGNPAITSPMIVIPGKGFPDNLSRTPKITSFYSTKVEHTLSKSGYFVSLDAADAYTLLGIGSV